MHTMRSAILCAASLLVWQAAIPAASAAGPSIAAVVNAANYQPVIASAARFKNSTRPALSDTKTASVTCKIADRSRRLVCSSLLKAMLS